MIKRLRLVALVVLLITVGAAALTWPDRQQLSIDDNGVRYDATVQAVEPCDSLNDATSCAIVDAVLDEGADAGQVFRLPDVIDTHDPLKPGDHIVVESDATTDAGFRYAYVDRQRLPLLAALAAALAVLMLVVGRLRGLGALASLTAFGGAIGLYALPALVDGAEPLLVAAVAGAFVVIASLYLTNRFSPMTVVATLGALMGLAVVVLLSWLVTSIGEFGGIAQADSAGLSTLGSAKPGDLLIVGIVLGAAGALSAVTMSHASTALNLRTTNPALPTRQLFAATLTEERPRLFSTMNTLVLAYAGATIPVLLLFVTSDDSLLGTTNGELVAFEFTRAATGLFGLALAAPLTTWLAVAALASNKVPTAPIVAPVATDERPPLRRADAAPALPGRRRTTLEGSEPKNGKELSLWQRMRQGLDD